MSFTHKISCTFFTFLFMKTSDSVGSFYFFLEKLDDKIIENS